ncbi:MAG: hypothetical protein HKN92_00280 [Chitinophagales bacterium]|nr:hypothetical protein [Chitinophagales bacterium]
MRKLVLIGLVIFALQSCTDESELINTLGCQAKLTYTGIDECYIMPAFVNEKDETVIPNNLEYFYDANELVIGTEYQAGYNPISETLEEKGTCEENLGKTPVRISCFEEL